MKQAISIQLIFILEIKLQKQHFSEKYHIFSARNASICAHVCHNTKTEKKAFTVKNQNKKQTNGIQVTVNLEIKLQKEQFFSKIGFF